MAIPPLIFDQIREKLSGSQAQRSFLFCSNGCCALRCLPKQAVSSGHQWRGGRRRAFLLGLCADPSLPDGPCVSAHWPSPSCSQRLSDHPAIPNALRTHTTSECGGNVVEDTGSITIRVFGSVDVCVDAPTLSLSTQPTVVIFVCTYMCMIDSFRCCAHAQIDWLEGLEAVRCHVWTVFVSMMSPDLSQILPRGCTLTCAIIHVPTHTHTHTFEHL